MRKCNPRTLNAFVMNFNNVSIFIHLILCPASEIKYEQKEYEVANESDENKISRIIFPGRNFTI